MLSTKIDTSGARKALGRLFDDLTRGAQRVVENAGAAAEKAARATKTFKDRTHELRSSIEHNTRGYVSTLRAGARHADWIENGTKPHIIRARRAPFLVFQVNGHWVRKKEVFHPGTKPRHFMRDAARQVAPIFLRNLEASTNSAIARHNR
jgi:hypothetical protein